MDLTIDKGIYDELYKTGLFEEMSLGTDEDEHSIEMHLPYVAKVRVKFVSSRSPWSRLNLRPSLSSERYWEKLSSQVRQRKTIFLNLSIDEIHLTGNGEEDQRSVHDCTYSCWRYYD